MLSSPYKYFNYIRVIGLVLFVVLVTVKTLAFVCSFNTDFKKSFVQENQENEKEETNKKAGETFAEKKFTISHATDKSHFLLVTQTLHSTIYLNNYESVFYGFINTPPPDIC